MKPVKLYEQFLNENRINDLFKALDVTNQQLFDQMRQVDGVDKLLKKLGLEGKTGKDSTDADAQKLADALNSGLWYKKLPVAYFFGGAEKLPANTTLLHFTNRADEIIQHGFTHGTKDPNQLGMSWGSKTSNGPGWNYAFQLVDILETYGSVEKAKKHWGRKETIQFEAPAVAAYHYGDAVVQSLFWGPDAKNIRRYDA